MTPETEAKLNELAERTHRGKDELLEEAVGHLLAYNEWFEDKVRNSLAAAERGETCRMKRCAIGLRKGNVPECGLNGPRQPYPI